MSLVLYGVLLLAVGFAGLEAMARRSVSLRILRAIRDGADPAASFEAGIASRVGELECFGLARLRDGRLAPTRLGRSVLTVTRVLRRATGVQS
jgi:hypothetical protein